MSNWKQLLDFIEMTIGDEAKVETTMIAAAAVIYKEGENGERMVLLIQRSAEDHWPLHFEFPRGKCDKPIGESPDKCMHREVKEETGLDVEIVKFIDKFQYLADGGTRKTVCYNFLCKMKDPNQKIKLSKEHDSYKWITQVGEAELLVMPDQKRTIEDVLSKDNSILARPKNSFTQNNKLDEFLQNIQGESSSHHKRRARLLRRKNRKLKCELERRKKAAEKARRSNGHQPPNVPNDNT